MDYPQRALPVWFGQGREKDAAYVSLWQNAPLTYTPDQPINHEWNVDRYETVLGNDPSGALFRRAAEMVLNNRFYPPSVMEAVSTFSLEGRPVRTGDRVLQRILILEFNQRPILEVLTLNEITEVIETPRKAGFTYTTTTAHSEIGEWSPSVEWRENGEVVLLIEVVSRTRPGASRFQREFTRRMQLRAHKLSIQNFVAQLKRTPLPRPEPLPIPPVAPAALAAVSIAVLLGLALKLRRK